MAELSGFLPSINGDNKQGYQFLASWIAALISNGTYNGELQVVPSTDMIVTLPAGRAWINGIYYENTAPLQMTIAHNMGAQPRIDSIVLRLDFNTRKIKAFVLQGVPGVNPVALALTRTENLYELRLANIYVGAGAINIAKKDITLTNLNAADCGIVTCVVDHVDASQLFSQLEAIKIELVNEILGIKQGSAVMLKSVYGGKSADSVKKADAATTAIACTGNAATVGDLSTLRWHGPELTSCDYLAAWERGADGHGVVTSILPADVKVGKAKTSETCTGNAATATNATEHIVQKRNPHNVTKEQVGLGSVENTADAAKRVAHATNADRATSAGTADRASYADGTDSAVHAIDAAESRYTQFKMPNFAYFDNPSSQNLTIRASNEFFGVYLGTGLGQGWSFSPESDSRVALGDPTCRWRVLCSASGVITTSDKNMKNTIANLPTDKMTELVLGLTPSSYKFNDGESGRTHYGLIAQDVEALLAKIGIDNKDFGGLCISQKTKPMQIIKEQIDPETLEVVNVLINTNVPIPGEYIYSLRYEEFIAPLIATVQAQQQQIDELSARLAALESKK